MKIFDLCRPLAAVLLLALAVQAQTVWDGGASTAWYTGNTSAATYTITTAEQLAGLAQLVNGGTSFEGKTITLGANIALNDTSAQGGWRNWGSSTTGLLPWEPIGNSANAFRGNFNGNGKVVSGLYINNSTTDYQGLFGIAQGGNISNLGLVGFYVGGKSSVGGISGRLNAVPTLSCTGLPSTVSAGSVINPPTVTCSVGSLTNLNYINAPSWSNPLAGTYNVYATGTCDGVADLTANCGTLSVCTNCLIDSRDGKVYRTVVIGTQTWMAENLNYDVPDNTTDVCYNNNASNCVTYGRLYNWSTTMDLSTSCNSNTCANQVQSEHRGICPAGWHIPSDAEWTQLTDYVGSSAATKLKATSGWLGTNRNGTDDYGFSALPGGSGSSNGSFSSVSNYGYWWSSSERGASIAYCRDMSGAFASVGDVRSNGKSLLYSIRCLKD